MMNRLRLLLVLLAVGACTTERITEPDWHPITGQIVARDKPISIGGPPTIHVKDAPTEECGIIFLARSSTQIFRRSSSGELFKASVSDLVVGAKVKVWAKVIMESCPGQSTAIAIEIY
jgi:hypothetical protein